MHWPDPIANRHPWAASPHLTVVSSVITPESVKTALACLTKYTLNGHNLRFLTLTPALYHGRRGLTEIAIDGGSKYNDSTLSKVVELFSRVWDHSSGRFLNGFRMLTVCWSYGTICLPMDFALLSSADAKKRLCESYKSMEKRCYAWQQRKKASTLVKLKDGPKVKLVFVQDRRKKNCLALMSMDIDIANEEIITQAERLSSLPHIQGRCRRAIVNYARRYLTPKMW